MTSRAVLDPRRYARRARRTLRPPARAFARNRRVRALSSPARILPSFFVLGGFPPDTTVLLRALNRHPDVATPVSIRHSPWSWKEIHFFDDKFSRGLGWYRAFFPLATTRWVKRRRGGDLVACESTPSYLFHPAVPARVAATLPHVRLVVLLRDPIVRACAQYEDTRRKGLDPLSFDEALAAEGERLAGVEERLLSDPTYHGEPYRRYGYVTRGLYARQLERWFEHLPREQVLVLEAEDFTERRAEVYQDVLSFLGLRAHEPARFPDARIPSISIDPATQSQLEERFAEPNAHLERLLGRRFRWMRGGREAGRDGVAGGRVGA